MHFEFVYVYRHIYRKWVFLVDSKCWNTVNFYQMNLYFIPESVSWYNGQQWSKKLILVDDWLDKMDD